MKQKNFLNNKKLAIKQDKFIHAIEAIGDILVFETKRRNKNKFVIQGLEKIEELIIKLFDIKLNDPDTFDKSVLSQEFLEIYSKNEEEAKFRLSFNPKKYLITFTTGIYQLLRIHEIAIEVKNDEVSRFATYHLNWVLATLSKIPQNTLFIEQLLQERHTLAMTAIANKDRSMYAASIHWYIDIVFNRLKQSEVGFNIEYLNLFDKYFFSSAQYIVLKNQDELFKSLISSMIDNILVPEYNRGKIWDFQQIIMRSNYDKYQQLNGKYNLDKRFGELFEFVNELDSKEKLKEWFEKYDELKNIVEPNLNEEEIEKSRNLHDEIKEYIESQFKFNNLLEIVYAIAAYCIFKKKYDYIKYIWEYKQPPDTDSHWIGSNIVPTEINDIINFYFKKTLYERRFDFWEDHHGSELYYRQYFLLLLAHSLQNIRPNSEGKYEQIENYVIPKFNIHRLSSIEGHLIDGFIILVQRLKENKEMLSMLSFDLENLDELFDVKLVHLLERLKITARERIHLIHQEGLTSQKKIEEFKNDVVKSFNDYVIFRNIFKDYLNLFVDENDRKYSGNVIRRGMNVIDDKAAFFDEWHVHYAKWGESYGRDMATGEDSYLFDTIASFCKQANGKDISEIINRFYNPSNVILISTTALLYRYIEESEKFIPKWKKDITERNVKGLFGWYSYRNYAIPIFEINHRIIDNQLLILNKAKLGKFYQYNPLEENDSEEFKKDIFFMKILSFSEDQEYLENYLKNPPAWIKEKGNIKKQKEYLNLRVLIQLFERYEVKKDEDFEGFLLVLSDTTS